MKTVEVWLGLVAQQAARSHREIARAGDPS
jgi:hypothetical protein